MRTPAILLIALCLALDACALPGHTAGPRNPFSDSFAAAIDHSFNLDQMEAYIRQISRGGEAEQQAEIDRLKAGPATTASDRLKLAYLLSLDDASPKDLALSENLLDGLDHSFDNTGTRLYVRLLQRTIASEERYQHEKSRADDEAAKLKQLKKLELDLMQRDHAQTPAQGQTK